MRSNRPKRELLISLFLFFLNTFYDDLEIKLGISLKLREENMLTCVSESFLTLLYA